MDFLLIFHLFPMAWGNYMLLNFFGFVFLSSQVFGAAPLGVGILYAAHPMAWGTYMLRKFVGVGFHSSQGKGAAS